MWAPCIKSSSQYIKRIIAQTERQPVAVPTTYLHRPQLYFETDDDYWRYFLGIEPLRHITTKTLPPLLDRLRALQDTRPPVPVGKAIHVSGAIFLWTEGMEGQVAPRFIVVDLHWGSGRHNKALYESPWALLLASMTFLARHTTKIPGCRNVDVNESIFFMNAGQPPLAKRFTPFQPAHRLIITVTGETGWGAWLAVDYSLARRYRGAVLVPKGTRIADLTGRITEGEPGDPYAIDHSGTRLVCTISPGDLGVGIGSPGFFFNTTCSLEMAAVTMSANEGLILHGVSPIERDRCAYRFNCIMAARDLTGDDFLNPDLWALQRRFQVGGKDLVAIPCEWVYGNRHSLPIWDPSRLGTCHRDETHMAWRECRCLTRCYGKSQQGMVYLPI